MLTELAARWTDEARVLKSWGDVRGAELLTRCATELDVAAREYGNQALTIGQAVEESGYSADHLRALVSSGEIPNAGRKGSPRIRRRDLPVKPGRTS